MILLFTNCINDVKLGRNHLVENPILAKLDAAPAKGPFHPSKNPHLRGLSHDPVYPILHHMAIPPIFIAKTTCGLPIRFRLYWLDAPVTSLAFLGLLPFSRNFLHARVSGHEIWIDDAPPLDIIQENASI